MLGTAAQRGLAGGVHVAHDHVRHEPLFDQRLRGPVDRDDDGAPVANERPQRAQVALMAHPAHDHERGAVAKVGLEAGQLDPARQELALLAHVLHRVAREALERLADLAPPGFRVGAHPLRIEHLAARQELAAAEHLANDRPERRPAVGARGHRVRRRRGDHNELIAVGDRLEQPVVGKVDEQDARLDEQLRTQVGIGPRGGRATVQHRRGARRDQLLGRHAVDVHVIDERDLAAAEMSDEQLRAAARAHAPLDGARGAAPEVGSREARGRHAPAVRHAWAARGRRGPRPAGSVPAGSCRSHCPCEGNAPAPRAHRAASSQAARRSSRACRRAALSPQSAPSMRTSSDTTSGSPS
jgi:hypothetical protein